MICGLALLIIASSSFAGTQCRGQGLELQVLGSGGPELTDARASSGYILWVDGRSRLLVDAGPGVSVAFERSGARFEELDAILLTHLHVDHSASLPAFVKGSYFTDRKRDLPVIGPAGDGAFPSTTAFLERMFGADGAYAYLFDYLPGSQPARSGAYLLRGMDVPLDGKRTTEVFRQGELHVSAIAVPHGIVPAVAYRVAWGEHRISFSGDTRADDGALEKLADRSELLVAHNAIPDSAGGIARKLHVAPEGIGQVARAARVARLVLSHRMKRTLGKEDETLAGIRRHYAGPVAFADDGDCFALSAEDSEQ